MKEKLPPTRGSMMKALRALKLAEKGHDLLEQKRQVLMMELVRHIDEAKELQSRVAEVFDGAYKALQKTNITLGIETVEEIALAIPEEKGFIVRLRSVMGVEIPEIDPMDGAPRPCYSFWDTSASMDRAFVEFRKVLALLARLAEIENGVYRLAVQIRKTHRRVNALEKMVIPGYGESIAAISNALEESDREDFVRMKMAKRSENAG